MLRRKFQFAAVCAAALALTACEGTLTKPAEGEGAEAPPVEERATEDASTSGLSSTGFQGHPLDDPDSLLSKRTIYFEYDKADIRPEDRGVVEAHAKYLASHPSSSLTLEGHADERGSREYNIALGERRGLSVSQLMSLLGGSAGQIRVISYGEERPAAVGHDDASWGLNRRVEIIYRSR